MRTPRVLPAALAATLGALVVLGAVPGSAVAETRGDWATWTAAPDDEAGAPTATVTLPGSGGPTATVTSDAGAADIDPGGSTWLAAATAPGEAYGSSRGRDHLVLGTSALDATAASVTTYDFDAPVPVGWALVLADVDPDRVAVSGTLADGREATAAQLGREEPFDYCEVPEPGPSSCADASGTAGATVWWRPTVPLTDVTVTYDGRGDRATYRTWLASTTSGADAAGGDRAPAGVDLDVLEALSADLVDVTGRVVTDGDDPVAGAALTLADADDELVGEATSAASGAFVLDDVAPGDYTFTVTPPAGYEVVGDEQAPLAVGPETEPLQITLARTSSTTTDPSPSPTVPDPVDAQPGAPGGPTAAAGPAVPVRTVVTTTPTTATPVTALPATGGPAAGLPWLGLVLLLGGGALVAASRRTAQGASR